VVIPAVDAIREESWFGKEDVVSVCVFVRLYDGDNVERVVGLQLQLVSCLSLKRLSSIFVRVQTK
jgi:hypothetical protein